MLQDLHAMRLEMPQLNPVLGWEGAGSASGASPAGIRSKSAPAFQLGEILKAARRTAEPAKPSGGVAA